MQLPSTALPDAKVELGENVPANDDIEPPVVRDFDRQQWIREDEQALRLVIVALEIGFEVIEKGEERGPGVMEIQPTDSNNAALAHIFEVVISRDRTSDARSIRSGIQQRSKGGDGKHSLLGNRFYFAWPWQDWR